MTSAEQTMRRRLLGVTALVLLGLITHSTYAGTGDEPHYLAIAHSLAFDRDLDLSNNYAAGEWITGGVTAGPHVAAGAGGVPRPVHDIGLPLIFAPYVAIVHPVLEAALPRVDPAALERLRVEPATVYRHAISAGMIAVALIVAWQVFEILMALGFDARTAAWSTLLVAVSPPWSIYSGLFFTEVVSAALALFVFRRIAIDDQRNAAHWAVAGGLAGLLVFVHIRNAGLLVALLGVALLEARRRGGTMLGAAFAIGAAVTIALRTINTRYLWGTWLATPHARAGEWYGLLDTLQIAGHRIAGLLIDQEYGLLPYAPIFLAAIAGFGRWSTARRDVRGRIAAAIGGYLILIVLPQTNAHGWTGGWSPAARFWVPVVPFLAIAVTAGLNRLPRPVVATLVAIQIVISAYFWQNPKNLWNDGDGTAAICERGGASFCGALPSLVVPADAVVSEAP